MICTFPGRYGDILWALPTVRALAEQHNEPMALYISGEFASLMPLLQQQPYLDAVVALKDWTLAPPEEWKAPLDPERYAERIVHLGYRSWPTEPLPYAISRQAGVEIDLTRPWITIDGPGFPMDVAVGFTEAWFELKLGLMDLLFNDKRGDPTGIVLTITGSRWMTEPRRAVISVVSCDWQQAARAIRNSDLFFGDCSALHVLACALGKRVLLMEPMEARWNPIFYPYGMDGPQVTVVKGLDGRPTFDARHCADAIREALAHA